MIRAPEQAVDDLRIIFSEYKQEHSRQNEDSYTAPNGCLPI